MICELLFGVVLVDLVLLRELEVEGRGVFGCCWPERRNRMVLEDELDLGGNMS